MGVAALTRGPGEVEQRIASIRPFRGLALPSHKAQESGVNATEGTHGRPGKWRSPERADSGAPMGVRANNALQRTKPAQALVLRR
jgi:hypothetical protein